MSAFKKRTILHRFAAILAAAPMVVAVAPHAAAQSFTIEQVMSAPFAQSLSAAPAGAKVAWIINEQGRRNLWVAGLRGRQKDPVHAPGRNRTESALYSGRRIVRD